MRGGVVHALYLLRWRRARITFGPMAGPGKKARERQARLLLEAEERAAREKALAAQEAERAALYWPDLIGTPYEARVAGFLGGCTPEGVIDDWRQELSALGIEAGSVVHTIQVLHPELARREHLAVLEHYAAWWPKTRFAELRRRILSWFERNPDTDSVPDFLMAASHTDGKGPRVTAALLAAAGPELPRIGAVLLAASLYARVGRSSRRYPLDSWPHIAVAETLLEWMNRTFECAWHPASTDTLPMHNEEYGSKIIRINKLIEALAVEHAKLLHAFVPVNLQFVETWSAPTSPLRAL